MPVTTVRFTRVFDRVDHMTRNRTLTVFSFESDGGTQYGVRVPGHPAIEPGMRVLAYLDKPGRWDTLVGWRNLNTGELVIESGTAYWLVLLMGAVVALFVASQRVMPLLWGGLVIAALLLPLATLLRIHRARRALLEGNCGRGGR